MFCVQRFCRPSKCCYNYRCVTVNATRFFRFLAVERKKKILLGFIESYVQRYVRKLQSIQPTNLFLELRNVTSRVPRNRVNRKNELFEPEIEQATIF